MRSVRRYIPYLVVFVSSMGVMIIELVASRLVSKYFGSSLYTWTGIIGVVLGGISLGNYIGGRLADRFRPRNIVVLLLLIASALTFLILLLDVLLYRIMNRGTFSAVSGVMVFRSLGIMIFLFFLPSTSLGTISPVMAKYALEDSFRVGNTVGSIYAVSAIGSIVGTFLSGYLLIPLLGITTIVVVVGSLLGLLALLMSRRGRWRAAGLGWVLIVALSILLVRAGGSGLSRLYPERENSQVLYRSDSRYSHLVVRDVRRGDRVERVLIQDALIHNRYDPSAPDELLYEYERIFDALTRMAAARTAERPAAGGSPDSPLRTLTLGAGGCVFPLYLERRYPGSSNEVVEIDPEVLEVAERFFDLEEDSQIKRVVADARNYVSYLQGRQLFDLIYLDAFNSFSIPYHLTTVEFTRQVASLLAPGGMLIANCIDILELGGFLNAYLNTVAAVFPHVAVYADTGFSPRLRATFVIAAGFRGPGAEKVTGKGGAGPDGVAEGEAGRMMRSGWDDVLYDESGRTVGKRLPEELLADLRRRKGEVILTDSYAPVENLTAPVFLKSVD
jgi:SAM-dependent methyltransferase